MYRPIVDAGRQVVSWQGVRAEESLARSLLPVWQRLEQNDIPSLAYRPLLLWTLADVWAMHEKHGLARNPLYEKGMERVGCMPCIMAKKQEVAEISRRFPEHVERIAEWEYLAGEASKRGATTFFSYDKTPGAHTYDKTIAAPGIRQVVEWAQTDKGGRQYNLETFLEFGTACNQWGACE
ncbi:phosphoadenosine phosphosulfate reductase domain-containing protein [Devosia aurantiaca]|uniref:phosphoadenosine phosphosulfate reductase domain-containing protein n=1 Tax=Devosia aurantiaca TaxID=2714858 RepID=UPI001A9920B0|nr:phosphoadenosine phosphosulfate reductase family protein [Devosia aurantiaca]